MSRSAEPTLTPVRFCVLAAVLTGGLGFVALNVFTLSGAGAADLPGLYTFRSATVGDGVLLPVLAYALVRAAGLQGGWRHVDRWLIAATALVGAFAGAMQVADWLRNPNPRVNWTYPAPHTFNIPGWYHAVFLVVACGFFAAASMAVLLRLRSEAREGIPAKLRMRSLGSVFVLAPGPTFLGLLLMDNDSPAGTATLVVLTTCFILGLLAWWSVGLAGPRWVMLACAASAGVALGVCGLFVSSSRTDPSAALAVVTAAFGGAFVTSALGAKSVGARLGMAVLLGITGAGAVHTALATVDPALPAAVWAMIGFATLVTIVMLALWALLPNAHAGLLDPVANPGLRDPAANAGLRELVMRLVVMLPLVAFALSGVLFAGTEQGEHAFAAALVGIVAAALFAATAKTVRKLFHHVIEVERAGPVSSLSGLKWVAYLATITAYGAALAAFLSYVFGSTATESWVDGTVSLPQTWRPVAALAAFLLVLLLCASMQRSVRAHPIPAVIACLIGLAWCAYITVELISGYYSVVQAILSVVAALFVGLFVYEGIVANTTSLQGVRFTAREGAVGVVYALVVALTTAWATGPAIADAGGVRGFWPALVDMMVAVVAIGISPFLAAITLPGARPAQTYTVGTPLGGVLQDAFLATIIWISIAWIPNLLLAHTPAYTAAWLGSVLFYLTMLAPAYFHVMKNNVQHVVDDKKRLDAATASHEQEKAHLALAVHIRKQNILALVVLIPGFAVFVTTIGGFGDELSTIIPPKVS